jgi:hypothetical protein
VKATNQKQNLQPLGAAVAALMRELDMTFEEVVVTLNRLADVPDNRVFYKRLDDGHIRPQTDAEEFRVEVERLRKALDDLEDER